MFFLGIFVKGSLFQSTPSIMTKSIYNEIDEFWFSFIVTSGFYCIYVFLEIELLPKVSIFPYFLKNIF